jgi:hypothetical protein
MGWICERATAIDAIKYIPGLLLDRGIAVSGHSPGQVGAGLDHGHAATAKLDRGPLLGPHLPGIGRQCGHESAVAHAHDQHGRAGQDHGH